MIPKWKQAQSEYEEQHRQFSKWAYFLFFQTIGLKPAKLIPSVSWKCTQCVLLDWNMEGWVTHLQQRLKP